MRRVVYDVGERVQWPETMLPATQDSKRALTILDRKVVRHRSGNVYTSYLYKELLDRMVEDMNSNLDNAFDNLVVIVGDEGTGKSHLGYEVCRRMDPDFDMEKSYIYSWEMLIESLAGDDPQKVYWIDEAINLAGGRDWMKENNKMLIKILQTQRSRGWTLVMCIPQYGSIDVYIREHRTRYLLIARMMQWEGDREAHRGYFELRVKPTDAEKARFKMLKDPKPEDFMTPKGYSTFPKMDEEANKLYEKVKLHNQMDMLVEMKEQTQEMKGKSRYKRDKQALMACISAMTDELGMSYKEVADITGMPYSTVKNIAWRMRNDKDEGGAIE